MAGARTLLTDGPFADTKEVLGGICLIEAGGARITHQTSVAARSGEMNWDDLNYDKTYDVMGPTPSRVRATCIPSPLDSPGLQGSV